MAPALASMLVAAFSAPLPFLQQAAYADCVSYDEDDDTIHVTCDTTFTHVAEHVGDGLIKELGGGEYLLKAILQVEDEEKLTISSDDGIRWIKITGDNGIYVYGSADITGVKITSWNESSSSVINNGGKGERAWLRFYKTEGASLLDSEFAYLGYTGGDSHMRGLSFDGDGGQNVHVNNSEFHHMWYAFYSNSLADATIENSIYHHNHKYAIDPHTGTHDMVISNNDVYSNAAIGIICSFDCYDIVIEDNRVYNHTDTGIGISRNMHDSIVRNNEIWNVSNGIYFSESPDNEVYGNHIHDVERAIYLSTPRNEDDGITRDNYIHDNEIDNVTYAIMASDSPINRLENNDIGNVDLCEYCLSRGSGFDIVNQHFSDDRIRGNGGRNSLSIDNSGDISINDYDSIDTDSKSYTVRLTRTTTTVNSE